MVQVPVEARVTVAPDTVQTAGVVEAKLTGSPELAVAEIVNGATPNATLLSEGNAIVWVAWLTVKLFVNGAAAV